ncbi:MAG: MFS transporter [Chloroflexota bacterium]|nr:MFS transporter [Chloroflexota bacterium]
MAKVTPCGVKWAILESTRKRALTHMTNLSELKDRGRNPRSAPAASTPTNGGAFNALRKYRDFRLLLLSTLFVGTAQFMQQVAMGWIALELTDSPLFVGIVAFSAGLAFILVAVPAGSYIDQLDRRLMLRVAQGASALIALVLAIDVLSGYVQPWHLPIGAFLTGSMSAILFPTQQAIAPSLVDRSEISNAVGLMSAVQSLSRVVGPTIAGTVIGFVSTGGSFLIQAFMVGTAFVMATLIRLPARPTVQTGPKGIARVLSGFSIVWNREDLRSLFALGFITPILILPFVQFLNIFARDILDIGASGLGYLMAISGVGSVAGALFVAQRSMRQGTARLQPYLLIVVAVAVIGIAVSTSVVLTFALLFIEGLVAAVMLSTNMALVQMRISDDNRGRVLGAYSLGFGLLPVAALPVGVGANLGNTQFAVGLSATIALVLAIMIASRSTVIREL